MHQSWHIFFGDKSPPKVWASDFPWYFMQPGFEDKFINNLDEEQTQFIVQGERVGKNKYELGYYIPDKLLEYINSHYEEKTKLGNNYIWQRKKY